jgi:hypothetical protein
MTIAEALHQLAERVDFDSSDEALKAIVSNPALSQIAIPDNFAQALNRSLMTESEAKINGNIKKHFTATALNGVDAKMREVLDEMGFDEESKGTIFAEQNSYNRIKLLATAISELKDKSVTAVGGEKKALLDKVTELQRLVNDEKSNAAKQIEAINQKWTSTLTDKEISSMFGNYDYALDVDKEIAVQTARNVWERELKNKGGKYVYTEEGVKLVNAETPDLPFTIENKAVDIRTFTDAVLANNKLLKVAKPATTTTTTAAAPAHSTQGASVAKQSVSKALADFRAGSM